MTRADLYDVLNRLLGTPTSVPLDDYTGTPPEPMGGLDWAATYIEPGADVLIIGCGDSGEVEWFCQRGSRVTAVEVNSNTIARVNKRTAGLPNFKCVLLSDERLPFEDNSFDLLFMYDVCEHIIDIETWFSEYYRVLKPGKALINVFAPLFFSPYGAHLQYALKMPWGHLLFGAKAVVDVRNRYYPDRCVADTWQGLGLNCITERQYRRAVGKAGFERRVHQIRTSLNIPIVRHIPALRNLFILGIKSVLVKPE